MPDANDHRFIGRTLVVLAPLVSQVTESPAIMLVFAA